MTRRLDVQVIEPVSAVGPSTPSYEAMIERSLVSRVKGFGERTRALRRALSRAFAGDDGFTRRSFEDVSTAVDEMELASVRLQQENDRLAKILRSLGAELRRYRGLFDLAPDGYLVTDAGGTILEANRASTALLGIGEDVLEGQPMNSFFRDETAHTLRARLAQLRQENDTHGWEAYVQPRKGVPFPVTVDVSAAQGPQGKIMRLHWQLHDITDRKRAEDEMAFRASHDELTGLPNRSMFQELLRLALARARRRNLAVAILYLDVDNFKLVNDTQGHQAGDELLRQVASRLRAASRETDLVSRLGGDEFAILLSDLRRDTPEEPAGRDGILLTTRWVADRVQGCLLPSFFLAGRETIASASIGVSMFPADSADEHELIEHADAAMYRSKKDGPGGVAGISGAISTGNVTSFSARLSSAARDIKAS